ncbi:acetylcholinesterase-like [Amphibalanus amphitrite]|uniref:acetylcholinesterase-like n=1 Tax=Amphibalanus amphitrite TaxID=1232801 RepID=UPI001C901938|nr:acetylcholinesterase-like [Amphibalanus amphitrite]
MPTFKGLWLLCSALVTSRLSSADKLPSVPTAADGLYSYLPPLEADAPAPDSFSYLAPDGPSPYDVTSVSPYDVTSPTSSYTSISPEPSHGPVSPAAVYGQASNGGGPLAVTQEGHLEGVTLEAASGGQVDAWLGVPYASPPVGDLRFLPPQPVEPWHGVREAKSQPNACWQVTDTFFGDFAGATQWNANTPLSEDCLYLNVHAPHYRPARPAAVLVWIYGGGFYSGSAALDVYDPTELVAAGGVVVVAMQYRVGSLGFLRLGDAPGNVGLLDQVAALRWVQRNAAAFGGDPNRVTLFGNSAGAASVSLHLLSPVSAPLFRRAVLQSGSATNPWAVQEPSEARRRALRLADEVDCPAASDDQALTCLREIDPETLVNSEFFTTAFADFPFAPVVDGEFLPEDPAAALAAGRFKPADLLAGTTSEEGNYFLLYALPEYANLSAVPTPDRSDLTRYTEVLNGDLSPAALLTVEHFYTPWGAPDQPAAIRDAVDKMAGDRQFTCGVNDVVAAHARKGGAVWQYQLRQRAPGSMWPRWSGVLHADEVFFLFGAALRKPEEFSREDVILSKRIIQYWTNFAKTGDPNYSGEQCVRSPTSHEWPLYEPVGQRYMVLSHYGPVTGHALRVGPCALWNHLVPRLNDTSAICDKV